MWQQLESFHTTPAAGVRASVKAYAVGRDTILMTPSSARGAAAPLMGAGGVRNLFFPAIDEEAESGQPAAEPPTARFAQLAVSGRHYRWPSRVDQLDPAAAGFLMRRPASLGQAHWFWSKHPSLTLGPVGLPSLAQNLLWADGFRSQHSRGGVVVVPSGILLHAEGLGQAGPAMQGASGSAAHAAEQSTNVSEAGAHANEDIAMCSAVAISDGAAEMAPAAGSADAEAANVEAPGQAESAELATAEHDLAIVVSTSTSAVCAGLQRAPLL